MLKSKLPIVTRPYGAVTRVAYSAPTLRQNHIPPTRQDHRAQNHPTAAFRCRSYRPLRGHSEARTREQQGGLDSGCRFPFSTKNHALTVYTLTPAGLGETGWAGGWVWCDIRHMLGLPNTNVCSVWCQPLCQAGGPGGQGFWCLVTRVDVTYVTL